jgi:hypothetical protein
MAGITALGTTYTLPNYTGILYQLTPADTPFFSAIGGLSGGGQTTNTEFEWQSFDLRSAAQPAVLEGQDAPTDQGRVRAQIKNVTQIHQETVGVSYTKQAAVGRLAGLATAGVQNPVSNEMDWQTEQMLKQMVRDIEYSFIRGTYQLPTDNTTARQTRGIWSAITTNVTDAAAGATSTGTATASTDLITFTNTFTGGETIVFTNIGTATGISVGPTTYYVSKTSLSGTVFGVTTTKGGTTLVDITANGTVVWSNGVALTKTMVDDTIQSAYDNGGLMESATATILCGSAQRRAITNAYLGSGAAGNYVYKELTDNVGGVTVDRIQTDFGFLNVMLDRHVPASTIIVCSLEQCKPVFLEVPGKGHFFSEPLAKTGAKDRVQLYGEVGLAYGNEKAHAKITNLKA